MKTTIREKKIAVIRDLVGHMCRDLENMNDDINQYDGEILKACLEAHFESLRVNSLNLGRALDGNRVIDILFEGARIQAEAEKLKQ